MKGVRTMAAEQKVLLKENDIDYQNTDLLDEVTQKLHCLPALVCKSEVDQLKNHLTEAYYGRAFVIQVGDCAERFVDAEASISNSKFNHLLELKSQIESRLKIPAISIGRIAGQYAKPRSAATEFINGKWVHVYRGDMINAESLQDNRNPNPLRILKAYDSSKAILTHKEFFKETIFTSHECLLLEYEMPLTRTQEGATYNLSTHFPWLGMRSISSAPHINYLSTINNPIALKIGPQTSFASMISVIQQLNPDNQIGKIALILRLGVSNVGDVLPKIIQAIRGNQLNVLWMSDPLHGNTQLDKYKRKFRLVSDAVHETTQICDILNKQGRHLSGLHLEATYKENIQECVSSLDELIEDRVYDSALDPRLNRMQCEYYIDQILQKIKA